MIESFANSSGQVRPRQQPRLHAVVFTEDQKSSKTYLEQCLLRTDGSVHLQVVGKGKHTVELVEDALTRLPGLEKNLANQLERAAKFSSAKGKKSLKKKQKARRVRFDQVWAVFDKDDFTDFDDAVKLSLKHGFCEGWSNECFELWYYLYTKAANDRQPIPRDDIFNYLTVHYGLQMRFRKHYRKLKGDAGLVFHSEMAKDDAGMENAYKRALALASSGYLKGKVPSARNPQTQFHRLMKLLSPGL